MIDSDKKALTKYYMPKVMIMYPGLFKSDYNDPHDPLLELQDSSITNLYFRIVSINPNLVYLKTYCSNYVLSLSLEIALGDLTNYNGIPISDDSCMGLFKLNIDFKCKDLETGKIKYCDKTAIIRRHTIKNIINEDTA